MDEDPKDTGTQDNNGGSQPEGSQPSATDKNTESGASQSASRSSQDDKVELSKEDHANLVAQRDKNFTDKKDLEQRIADLENSKNRKEYLDEWFEENSEDYPGVTREDLDLAQSPDTVEEIARFAQRKVEDAEQKALEEIQKVDAPTTLTQDEFEDREKELKKQADDGDRNAFDSWLDAQSQLK